MIRILRFTLGLFAGFLLSVHPANAQLNPPTQVGGPAGQPAQPQQPAAPQQQAPTPTPTPPTPIAIPADIPTPTPLEAEEPKPATKALYVFNLEEYLQRQPANKTWQYDVINLVSALQGLVNRQAPQLYILYVREQLSSYRMNVDEFWLGILRRPGEFLSDYELIQVKTLEELLKIFRSYYSSAVLWDPNVPATGNVALTIAGADGMIPVRYDRAPNSLFNQIIAGGPEIPPQIQLTEKFSGVGSIPGTNNGGVPSTEVPKTDAYLWAKINYLDSGACSSRYLANYLDPYDWEPREEGYQYPDLQECSIVNHDFYVSQKAFFLDLDPWFDETATDTKQILYSRGKDQAMFFQILQSAFQNTSGDERMLRVGGFVPLWIKYSNQYRYNGGVPGSHTPPATAEEFIGHISKYNGVLDADSSPIASVANASVYQHFPLKDRYFQNPVTKQVPLENKNYLLFVIGDFRSSAQLYQTIPTLWHDSLRGELPLAWAIAPILSDRVPHIFDYLYHTRTGNDYFVSGASGAGLCYLNRYLPADRKEGLGDRIPFWQELSQAYYTKFDLRASVAADLSREARDTSFSKILQSAFTAFSPHGVGTLKSFETALVDNVVPFVQEKGNFFEKLPALDATMQKIAKNSRENESTFQIYRFHSANPTTLFLLYQSLKQKYPKMKYDVVDPFTFFYLLRQKQSSGDPSINFLIPNFLSNTIPLEMESRGYYPSDVTVRNDGWDTWTADDQSKRGYRLTYRWYYEGEPIPGTGWHDAYVKEAVYPGDQTTFNLNILSPERAGLYRLILIFGQETVRESSIQKEIRVVISSKTG